MKKPSPQPAWPSDKVEKWPLAKLVTYQRNALSHPPEQIAELVALIHEFGWTYPILVDERGEIIAGHGRVLAAAQMGLAKVPVMVAKGWSEAQKRAYRLADNAVSRRGSWIPEMVEGELAALDDLNYDVSGFGLDLIELPPIDETVIPASTERAPRTKSTIFVSVRNDQAEKARTAIIAALKKAKIDHNL